MLFATGAGAQASSWLLSRPGASATVLETRTPYSRRASRELLDLALPAHRGADPRAARAAADADAASLSYASREMAVRLARAAHVRAMQLAVHLPAPSRGGPLANPGRVSPHDLRMIKDMMPDVYSPLTETVLSRMVV